MSDNSPVTLRTADDVELSAYFHVGTGGLGAPVIVVAPAIGIPQRFYFPFIQTMQRHAGCRGVLSFDYRCVGESLRGKLTESKARLSDWGEYDLNAALAWCLREHFTSPINVVAHSIGVVSLGLAPLAGHVRLVLGVAGGHCYWKLNDRRGEFVRSFFGETIPADVEKYGYFPGAKKGLADLPPRLAMDLSTWTLSPDFVVNESRVPLRPHYKDITGRVQLLGFEDDHIASQKAVERLAEYFGEADVDIEILSPSALGLEEIGHFGFFHRRIGPAMWPQWMDFLTSQRTAKAR